MTDGLGPAPQLAAVQAALQAAIQLEHATIPPYLYALYSLDPARNGAIADIIQGVVVEEMLHMTACCMDPRLSLMELRSDFSKLR